MKICLVANPNSAHTRRSMEGLLERGYQITLIGEHSPLTSPPNNIKYIDLTRRINIRRLRFLIWYFVMPNILNKVQPDILHSIGASGAAWLGSAASFHPFVITATGSDLLMLGKRSLLHNRLTRRSLLNADHILCLGEHLKKIAISLGVHANRIETAIFGIDTTIFHPPSKIPDHPDVPTNPVVISLRAMSPIYNPLVIAQAIPGVLDVAPQTRFLIMTYNANQETLEQFQEIVHSHNADYAVQYLPSFKDDREIANVLLHSDIALSIPSSDGTPASVLESMACGNAIIVSDLPSLHDWIIDGKSGLFVTPGDVLGLSQAILRLIKNPYLRERMGREAANFAREHASRECQFDQLEQVYRKLYG